MAKQVKRLNKRFVAFLAIGIMALLTIIMAMIIITTSRKDPTLYGDRGNAFMAQGDYVDAARSYSNAYRHSKKDPQWLLKLAEAQYQAGEEGQALGALANALIADPNMVDAQKRTLEIYYELIGRVASSEAMNRMEEEADKLISMIDRTAPGALEDPPEDQELRQALALGYHCRGIARFGQRVGNPALVQAARGDIQKALELNPLPQYVESLAFIILDNAQQMVHSAQAATVTSQAYDGFIRRMRESLGEAEKLYQGLIEQTPQDSEIHLLLGNFYFQVWGILEQSMGQFAQRMSDQRTAMIDSLNQQIAQSEQDPSVSADARRRIRQQALGQIAQFQQELPDWTRRAGDHREQASKYFAQAHDLYRNAITLSQEDEQKTKIILALANYLAVNDDLEGAEAWAREAVELDAEGYSPYRTLSGIIRRSALQIDDPEDRRAKVDQAIDVLERRIYELPHDYRGARGRRNRLMRLDLMGAMVEMLLNRNQPEDMKKADRALEELTQSELQESPLLYQLRAQRALVQNDTVTAIRLLERADSLSNEQNPQIKLSLAEIYYRRGEFGIARNAVDAGLRQMPGSQVAWRLAASVYIQLGEHSEALEFVENLLSIPELENDTDILSAKLECLVNLGHFDQADALAERISELGVDLNWPIQKARLFIIQGKVEEAEAQLKHILVDDPDNKLALIFLVDLYAGTNRNQEAQVYLSQALEKDPDDPELKRVQELLAITDRDQRREKLQEMSQEMAEKNRTDALARAEEEPDPYLRAVRLFEQYMRQDEFDQARKHLDQAMKLDRKKANNFDFVFGMITEDWSRAEQAADYAKVENLDSIRGLTYESRLNNGRGWSLVREGKQEAAKPYFEASARAAELVIAELPNHSNSRALLGEAYYWLGRQGEATTQIDRALNISPTNPYALRVTAVRQWEEIANRGVLVSAELIQEFAGNLQMISQQMPWDPWIKDKMDWLGDQIAKQREFMEDQTGDIQRVHARRERIRERNPEDTENLARLAWIYENRDGIRDLEKAEKCYRDALTHQTSADLIQLYMGFATRNNRMESMETFLRQLAEDRKQDGDASGYNALGTFYMILGDGAKAEQAFVEAVQVEDTPAKRLALSMFYSRTGDFRNAADWSLKTLEQSVSAQQDRSARLLLVNSLLAVNDLSAAEKHLQEYQKHYKDAEGKILQVRLAIEQGQMSQAESLVNQMIAENPENTEALDYRSIVYILTWQIDRARLDLERMRSINPDTFGLIPHIKLVKLNCELGRTADALQEARDLITRSSNQPPEWLERIRAEMTGPLSSAVSDREYEEFLIWASNVNNTYWGWFYELGSFLMVKGRYVQAEQMFVQSLNRIQAHPDISPGLMLMVLDPYLKTMYRSRSYDKIIGAVDNISKQLPDGIGNLLAWQSAAYYASGRQSEGFETYLQALEKTGNNLPVVWQMTNQVVLEAVESRELMEKLESVSATSEVPSTSLKLALATCAFKSGDVDQGTAIYRQLISQAQNPNIEALLLSILSQELTDKQDYAEAVDALSKAKQRQPNNPAILNNLAFLLSKYLDKPQEALPLIEQARNLAPSNPDILDTYGQILFSLGNMEGGLLNLTKSVWIKESSVSRYHLGMMLLKQNRRNDANLQLNRALQLVGEDAVLEKQIREALDTL